MYSLFYRTIQKIILKRSFYKDFFKIIKNEDINHIVEVGCADSVILKDLNEKYYYDGFDVEEDFIKKSKNKYVNSEKYKFEKKAYMKLILINMIKKTIILLIGVFHHVNDEYVKIFLKNSGNFKVYAIDAVRLSDQNFFTKLLMDFDKGKFVRAEHHYKKLLHDYEFILARDKYLNFKYDHLISVKNLNSENIKKILKFN